MTLLEVSQPPPGGRCIIRKKILQNQNRPDGCELTIYFKLELFYRKKGFQK